MAATKKHPSKKPASKKPASHKHQPAQPAKTHSDNPGNFANDHERAVEAGRKGGQHSHQNTKGKP